MVNYNQIIFFFIIKLIFRTRYIIKYIFFLYFFIFTIHNFLSVYTIPSTLYSIFCSLVPAPIQTKPAPIQTKPAHINNTQNGTIEKLIDDYYGPGTSADKYVSDKLNKNFEETKRFRKWHIGDPYSDGEMGTDLEIRQRKSNGMFEIKEHNFFADDPEYYYDEPSKWKPYKFS